LGLESDDLDITIDKMMGYDFAVLFNNFLMAQGYSTSSIGVVGANPEQSKHLQTAIVTILDRKIDFVNMRSEMYTEESRIPSSISFGTPLEDAHRRDTTINSLYYNIHTGLLEDWTRLGLADLEAGLIRTPLPPADIFTDDPLRMLRCVRFASRFDFRIHNDIVASIMEAESVIGGLARKVSRERIGTEMKKMLTCTLPEAPLRALKFLHFLNLMSIIYKLPPYRQFVSLPAALDIFAESFLLFKIFSNYIYRHLERCFMQLQGTRKLPTSFENISEDHLWHRMTTLPIAFPFEPHSLFVVWNALSMLPFAHSQVKYTIGTSDKQKLVPTTDFVAHFHLKVGPACDYFLTFSNESYFF
jgi:tRNA nucleotidyltransferase/poly(A) polymerase